MKVIVKRIERVNRSGTSKAGNPYSIDRTNLVIDVAYDGDDGFGSKEMVYQYGSHSKFLELESLRGKLPCSVDIELGTKFDDYDNPVTVVTSLSLPNSPQTQGK